MTSHTPPQSQPPPQPADTEDDKLLYWPLDEVRTDVHCPNCGHNLRGLRGRVISCPECGHRCDIAKLVKLQWNPPLRETPYIRRVLAPASFLYSSLFIAALDRVVLPWLTIPHEVWFYGFAMIAAVWGIMVVRIWLAVGIVNGSALVLLGHVSLLTCVMAMVAATTGISLGIMAWYEQAVLNRPGFWVTVMATFGTLLTAWPAWWCHRRIKRLCIQIYLHKVAMKL